MQKLILLVSLLTISLSNLFAQNTDESTLKKTKQKTIEISSGIEGNIFQFANLKINGVHQTTIPRYTYFFNMGTDVNIKVNKAIYPFTGISVKNIGLIQKIDSIKIKRRIYTVGVPLGVKFAISKSTIFKIGAEANLAINYKEKSYVVGNKKNKYKYNEFFSERTPLIYPSFFAGFSTSGISFSANYYFQNFFNSNYAAFYTHDAKLFTISLGINIDQKTINNMYKNSNISL